MTTSAAPRHRPSDSAADESAVLGERQAARFFWTVLILATGASVAGNVAHAVLNAPASTVLVGAAAALVPPTVLLGATHSVALLVKTRASNGFTYWCALLMTLALALCAFVLSFDALQSLALTAGIDRKFAWLWPLVIDVSIAQATMALLSLTRRRRTSLPSAAHSARPVGAKAIASSGDRAVTRTSSPPLVELHDAAAESRWRDIAEALVRERRTKIEPAVVARVLAMTEARTPPSTIGRRLNVHHSAVRRIQEAARELSRTPVPGL
jgi:hypothetical protein